ncbi:MAG TPA: FAD-dependent oxidoreductase [Kofleriaceae bacterium]|nr:FAD-dependent oxidoreductase [Kofleriaceae bacterium]
METLTTTCCIAGGGPAGMMLGWLLARAGVDVIVLERHRDFLRDFRGDTIHPSTLDVLAELGALDELLALPHRELPEIDFDILGERVAGPDLARLPTRCKFFAMMPQWDFLEFVRRKADILPRFHLMMESDVTGLVRDGERIAGVTLGDGRVVRARLVVGCDGRHSVVRTAAGLRVRDLGAPIDVMWMKLRRLPIDRDHVFAIVTADQFLVMLDRGDYWQCAYLIEKGGFAEIRERGIAAFRGDLRRVVPQLGERVDEVRDWDDIKLLTVRVDRLERWAVPGLLCIGDAAHAMSPVGGVGINLAVQDAVATANLLARGLREGTLSDAEVDAVQARREPATRKTQALQLQIHARVLAKVVRGRGDRTLRIARWLLRRAPVLRRYVARAIGVGYTPEHVAAVG